MAAALARLFQATGENRFAEGVVQALAYERSEFSADRGNWPDFRTSSDADKFMLSWCHGAPGILLSRHAIKIAGLADEQCEVELRVARTSTLAALNAMGQARVEAVAHLCCGLLGLTSLLRIDALAADLRLESAVATAEGRLIASARSGGGYKLFGIDSGSLNLPGMFCGQAGVALALLEAGEGLHWLPAVLSGGLLELSLSAKDVATFMHRSRS
jgi:lantibiotic modifying enzyme